LAFEKQKLTIMNRIGFFGLFSAVFALLLVSSGCRKDKGIFDDGSGKIIFSFLHCIDGAPLVTDSMGYINEAGNEYLVEVVRCFISNITFHRTEGPPVRLKSKDIWYIDTKIPGTREWAIQDPLPAGTYTGISFTFGLDEKTNKPFLFTNYPEVAMSWPTPLGGGYHYLMIDGKWNDNGIHSGFNYHMGIGQIYDPPGATHPDSIIEFVHNHFEVVLPNSAFVLADGQTLEMEVIMQIQEWFRNPHVWDHGVIGTATMQNQAAMNMMKLNGHNVFTTGNITAKP